VIMVMSWNGVYEYGSIGLPVKDMWIRIYILTNIFFNDTL
jgi:hypothetical protein